MVSLARGPEAHVGAAQLGGLACFLHVIGEAGVEMGLAANMSGEAVVPTSRTWREVSWDVWGHFKN